MDQQVLFLGAALSVTAFPMLVWIVRYGAALLDNGKKGAADSTWRAVLARLPVSLLAGAVATLLALMLFVLWSWIVLWVRWDGGEPVPSRS